MAGANTVGGNKSKLVNIEYLDGEQDVYDFYVPEGNEYLANGIVSHNSALAVNLMRNITEYGAEDCCLVPLEMSASQVTDRLMGILTGLDVTRISSKRLTEDEKTTVKTAYRKYVKTLKENNTRYSVYEPQEDLTIEEILLTLKPMGYRVILIDYISLLKGADGDDQWRQLGNIARFAKVFAKTNNIVVILLCQVSEEGRIRYAQSIAEHCLTGDTWIDLPSGPRQLRDIVESHAFPGAESGEMLHEPCSFPVTSENGVRRAVRVHCNGRKPVRTLTLANGMTVRGTETHRFLVLRPSTLLEWVALKNLRRGDLVAQNTTYTWPKDNVTVPARGRDVQLTEPVAYLLGACLPSKYVAPEAIPYAPPLWETYCHTTRYRVENCLSRGFYMIAPYMGSGATRNRVEYITIQPALQSITEVLVDLVNLCEDVACRTVPSGIMRSPRFVVLDYLRGFYDFARPRLLHTGLTVKVYNQEFGQQLAILLQRLGIATHIRTHTRCTTVVVLWNHVTRFIKTIGLTNNELKYRIERGTMLRPTSSRTRRAKATPSYKNVLVIPEMVKQASQFEWVRVKSVVRGGFEDVYDLTVEGTHSYVANGLISHNSNNAWVWTVPGNETDVSILDINQIKARNQRRFRFQLQSHNSSMQITDATPDTYEKAPKTTDKASKAVRRYTSDLGS